MTPARCIFCAREVLELEGQFDILEGYLLDPAGPADVPVGACHTACLVTSPWGPLWAERRVEHHAKRLRHEQVAHDARHHVFRDRRNREWVAIAATGEVLAWRAGAERAARRGEGGRLFAVEQEYNLELPAHPAVIAEAQAALAAKQPFALARVIDALGLASVVRHPAALAGAAFVLDRELRGYWTAAALSARVRYARFVPDDVLALVASVPGA